MGQWTLEWWVEMVLTGGPPWHHSMTARATMFPWERPTILYPFRNDGMDLICSSNSKRNNPYELRRNAQNTESSNFQVQIGGAPHWEDITRPDVRFAYLVADHRSLCHSKNQLSLVWQIGKNFVPPDDRNANFTILCRNHRILTDVQTLIYRFLVQNIPVYRFVATKNQSFHFQWICSR